MLAAAVERAVFKLPCLIWATPSIWTTSSAFCSRTALEFNAQTADVVQRLVQDVPLISSWRVLPGLLGVGHRRSAEVNWWRVPRGSLAATARGHIKGVCVPIVGGRRTRASRDYRRPLR